MLFERAKTRRALIKSAVDANRAGEIDKEQLRLVRMAAWINPTNDQGEALYDLINEEVEVAEEAFGAVDWDQFLELLQELLPVILKFIKLIWG